MSQTGISPKQRRPTHSERARFYEDYLYRIHDARQSGSHEQVMTLLNGISDWCWAHRDHNGTLPQRQVNRNVYRAFWRIFGS